MIFLGDYVDRGPNSVEVVNTALELKRYFPENVVMLRGNHEVEPDSPNAAAGTDFFDDVTKKYGASYVEMHKRYILVFGMLPLAAKSENGVLFMHGGPGRYAREELSIAKGGKEVERDALWSDPRDMKGVAPNVDRGIGSYYGQDVVSEALGNMKCKVLIRSHEPLTADRVEMFDGKLLTIFSSGIYRHLFNINYKIGYGYVSLEKEVENVRGILQDI